MSVVSRLKSYLFRKNIERIPTHRKVQGRINPSGRIGLLYSLNSAKELTELLGFYEWLLHQGKEVEVILYAPKIPSFSIPEEVYLLVREDLNWYFIPKKEVLEALPEMRFDILINFDRTFDPPIHYLCTLIHSDLKLGFYPTDKRIFDIFIDTPRQSLSKDISSVKETIRQISV